MKSKIKILAAALLITVSSNVFASDAGSLILGLIVGSQLVQPKNQYPVYIQPYQQPYVHSRTVIITPLQVPFYDENLHKYCAGYDDYKYANCLDNIRRQKFNEQENRYYRSY